MLMRSSSLQSPFTLSATWLSVLLLPLMASPSLAADAKLSFPEQATFGVEFVENVTFADGESSYTNILLRPYHEASTSHHLPEYCVIIGDATRSDERVRITAHDVTCIEAESAESAIFTGEIDAGVYDTDGKYGLLCEDTRCEFAPEHHFTLTLNKALSIEAQDNPSAELNAQRRLAGQEDSERAESDAE
ncbi:hypothetical protein ACLUEY_01415 [Vreelandella aquamarina]